MTSSTAYNDKGVSAPNLIKPNNWNEEFIWKGFDDEINSSLLEWFNTPICIKNHLTIDTKI